MKTDYSVMNAKVIGASAKKLGVKAAGDLVAKHRALAEHFKKKGGAGSELFECTTCGGLSTDDWNKCPYCGGDLADDDSLPPANGAAFAPPAEELATTEPAVLTVADLDRSVKAIVERKATAAWSVWDLGAAIRLNYEQELWKLRLTEAGKVTYTNYKRFVEKELGMSHTMAFNLIEVAKTFTREDVAQVGVTKLAIIARIEDAEARKRFLEGAKNGASIKQTRAGAAAASGKEEPPDEKVTFVARTGPILTFPMKQAKDGEDAKRVEVGVWAEETHENGVTSLYSVELEGAGDAQSVVLRINRYRG